MHPIPGIQIQKEIYTSNHSRIFEGIDEKSGDLVILKYLQDAENKSYEKIRKFLMEYQILKKFDHPGIIKPIQFINSTDNPVLILEYGGISLRNLLLERKLFTEELISIALQTAGILSEIHSQKIIHKDINPGNIVYNPETGKIKIIDFGISSILSIEKEILKNPNVIEGTLAYISPEQTGRMNRMIDYRTDFYSLGITLFELFNNSLPFYSKDSMELIHQHLTSPSPKLHENVPEFMIRIIHKLMSKNAEDRYQTAYGLKVDIQACITLFRDSRSTIDFNLGTHDFSPELNIPQKLYGRENEIQKIMEIFERAGAGRVEVVLVSGYSGAGKSALVRELYKPITRQNGYFLSGKFDQLQKDIPYSALIHVFQELVAQIMTEPKERINYWKDSFLKALSPNASVIIDVIPELGEILGDQPPVPVLEPKEAQNRYNLYFEKFIRVLLKKEHPLVIFLDDLQWADGASLRFIQNLLLGRNIEHFLFIGAYRDNEVYSGHPSMNLVSELEKGELIVHHFQLTPLGVDNISRLLEDTLPSSTSHIQELANLLKVKTEGNPFFLRELLKTLYEEDQIRFLHTEGLWTWDIQKIMSTSITGNVVELMSSRLKKLPESTKNALKYAACIGNEFDLRTLSIISKTSISYLAESLLVAIQAGLILSHSNDHKFLLLEEEHAIDINIQYKFIHDRIQQVAYLLIPDEEKEAFHLQIGEIYLERYSKEELETKIFDIVGHLNKARKIILLEDKKLRISELNFISGKRAKSSAAYEMSYEYFKLALEMLEDSIWINHYNFSYQLHLEIIESAYLSGQFKEMERFLEITKSHLKDDFEKVNVMILEMSGLMAQGKLGDVLQLSSIAFKLLNFSISDNPSKLTILRNYLYVYILTRISKKDFLALGEIKDERNKLILKIIYIIGSSAVLSNPNYAFLIVLKAIIFNYKYGFSNYSATFIVAYSFLIGSYLNNLKDAKYYSEIIEKLKIENKLKFRTDYINFLLKHYFSPIKDYVHLIKNNYFYSLENGDIEYASHSIAQYISFQFIRGENLNEIKKDIFGIYEGFIRLSQLPSIRWVNSYMQAIHNLTESINPTISMDGEYFIEDELLPALNESKDNSGIFNFYLLKNVLGVIFGINDKLISITEEMFHLSSTFTGSIVTTFYTFLDSFILMNHLIQNKIPGKFLNRVKENQKKIKYWSEFAPSNRLHHYLFIEGMLSEYGDKPRNALDLYEEAILKASENGFIMEEAIFCEHTGRYCFSLNKKELGEFFLNKSWKMYQKWGALVKLKLLENEFSFLRKTINPFVTILSDVTTVIDISREKQSNLDLKALMKFSQTISGEIEKEKLLSKIMSLILQNAGATYACILLEESNELILESKMRAGEELISLKEKLEDSYPEIPVSVVRYVFNRKENVLLNNAFREGNFTFDTYIQSNQILSILCVPLLNQGKRIGVLYLENNLIKGAFTSDRIEVLKVISSQAAISLENAKLYESLTKTNKELEETGERAMKAYLDLEASQKQLVQSDKMITLGTMVAGVAHEINTPLGAIKSNSDNISQAMNSILEILNPSKSGITLENLQNICELLSLSKEYSTPLSSKDQRALRKKIISILESKNLINSDVLAEKIIEIGLVDALESGGEIFNNPNIYNIINTTSLLKGILKKAGVIQFSADRVSKIVKSLKSFMHFDHSEEKKPADLTEGIETVLIILHNKLKYGIEVIKNYGELPQILCYADELNQIWTNLIHNAIQAMGEKGTLRIDLEKIPNSPLKPDIDKRNPDYKGEYISISIQDSGHGIPPEIREKIFQAFFTTKAAGEGSGLGLHIIGKILEKHSGALYLESEPGRTRFSIVIPMTG